MTVGDCPHCKKSRELIPTMCDHTICGMCIINGITSCVICGYPLDKKVVMNEANRHYDNGGYEAAIAKYDKISSIYGEECVAYMKAKCYLAINCLDKAEQYCFIAIHSNPKVLVILANIYRSAGRYDDEKDILYKISHENLDNETTYRIGEISYEDRKYDVAIGMFTKCYKQNYNYAKCMTYIGDIYVINNDKYIAMEYYLKASNWFKLGEISDNDMDAMTFYNRGVTIHDCKCAYKLAKLYEKMRLSKLSERNYKLAIDYGYREASYEYAQITGDIYYFRLYAAIGENESKRNECLKKIVDPLLQANRYDAAMYECQSVKMNDFVKLLMDSIHRMGDGISD